MPALVLAVAIVTLSSSCGDDDPDAVPATAPTTAPAQFTPEARPPTEMELPIRIAVTLPLFAEFAKDAGLENVEVISLIPPGADPHTYELTDADIARMAGIDFFFLNGLGLDDHLQDAIEENRDDVSYVIPFAPNIRSPQGGGLTAEQADDNPHLWLDTDLAYIYPEIVADELIIYDGIHKGIYDANFAASRERIVALQGEVQSILNALPPDRRKLITLHDSFQHFARRFGLTQAAFAAQPPVTSVTQEDLNRLAQVVREQEIPAVFTEFGYDSGVMNSVGAAAGVPVCTLYSDIIGGEATTYADAMLANAREIVRCLGTVNSEPHALSHWPIFGSLLLLGYYPRCDGEHSSAFFKSES